MRFHKIISTILHPIVIPTVGVMLYFIYISNNFEINLKFSVLSVVFIVTYLIPLFILIVLKRFRIIKSYQTETIKERKLPVALMILLFYALGNRINHLNNLEDLAALFYASSVGLFIIYILFFFKIKASIHLLSLGISIGYFMILSWNYSQSFILIIAILILLSGILGSARLHLKAHKNHEIYIGFFLGICSPIVLSLIL